MMNRNHGARKGHSEQNDMPGFAARAAEARVRLGLSQGEVSRRLNAMGLRTRPETISRYESGTYRPSVPAAAAIAAVLGVTTDYLLEGSVPTPPPPTLERVIAELALDPASAAELRAMRWLGDPSEATLRSYALDLLHGRHGH